MCERPLIAIISGSLQPDGLTHRIARAVEGIAANRLDIHYVPIGDLPLYNPALEADGARVAAWSAFREAVAPADGVLFVTPEYNRSVPAALKNAVDVGSRPYGASVFSGKPAGIISQSPGALGGFGANHHLRQSLVFLDMPAMQQPEVYLGHSSALFGEEGELVEGQGKSLLETFVAAFADWVDRHPVRQG
jgi:chromate reductase